MDRAQIRQLALELAEAAIRGQQSRRLLLPGSDGLEPLSDEDHAALRVQLDEIAEAVACDLAARALAELGQLNEALLARRDAISNDGPRQGGRQSGLEQAAGMVREVAARLAGKGAGHADR